jgi:hypothetical protein
MGKSDYQHFSKSHERYVARVMSLRIGMRDVGLGDLHLVKLTGRFPSSARTLAMLV